MEVERITPYIVRLEEALNRVIRLVAASVELHQPIAPGPLLSGSQRIVLNALLHKGACQVSEVAGHLGVTFSAATGLVDRLVKAKLVTRTRDQTDRRIVWVRITPEGEAAVKAAEIRRRLALQTLVQNLPESDLATLCAIMERLG